MNWPIILLGVLLGLVLTAAKISKQERIPPPQPPTTIHQDSPTGQRSNGNPDPQQQAGMRPEFDTIRPWYEYYARYGSTYDPRSIRRDVLPREIPQPSLQQQARNELVNTRTHLECWRKSIVGLLRLAESNLDSGRRHLEIRNLRGTVEAATASVENASRALMHCYGEKPELGSGQEEALRLLSRRFRGNEKIEFEKAIDDVACLYRNKTVQEYLSTHNIALQIIDEAETKQILDCAFRIVKLFRQIISDNFATEIPELGETCPKCHALSISLWTFAGSTANYECNVCHHKWIQPRAL